MKQFFENMKAECGARPLALSCFVFMLVSFFMFPSSFKVKCIVFSVSFLLFCLLLFPFIKRLFSKRALQFSRLITFFIVLSCVIGYLTFNISSEPLLKNVNPETEVQVEGYIEKTVYNRSFSSLQIMKVEKVNGKNVHHVSILVKGNHESELFEYERLEGTVRLDQIHSEDSDFDASSYYASKNIYLETSDLDSIKSLNVEVKNLSRFFQHFQSRIGLYIDFHFGEESAAFLKALFLADKSGLGSELKRDFRVLGISHMLAVSGMHLSVLTLLMSKFLLLLRIPKKIRLLLLSISTLLFMTLCGFTLSVCRAGVMLLFCILGEWINEKSDSFTSLFVSGTLIICISPFSIFDFGFLLSFTATFGILVGMYRFQHTNSIKQHLIVKFFKSILFAFLVTFFAQVAVIPMTVLFFGKISIIAPFSNLLFTPVFTLLMYFGVFALVFSFIPYVSTFFSFFFEKLVMLLLYMSSYAKDFQKFYVSSSTEITKIAIPIFILLFFIFLFTKYKKSVLSVLIASVLLWEGLCYFIPKADPPFFYTCPSGKNDLFILYDAGESLFIDVTDGSIKRFEIATQILEDKTGQTSPDSFLLTHYHVRHQALFQKILATEYLDRVYLPIPISEADQSIYDALTLLFKEKEVEMITYTSEHSITFGPFVFHKEENQFLKRSTHPIISFTVQYDAETFRYLSSSALEGTFPHDGSMLYFGVHGPITKEAAKKLPDIPIYIADPDLYEILDIEDGTPVTEYFFQKE